MAFLLGLSPAGLGGRGGLLHPSLPGDVGAPVPGRVMAVRRFADSYRVRVSFLSVAECFSSAWMKPATKASTMPVPTRSATLPHVSVVPRARKIAIEVPMLKKASPAFSIHSPRVVARSLRQTRAGIPGSLIMAILLGFGLSWL